MTSRDGPAAVDSKADRSKGVRYGQVQAAAAGVAEFRGAGGAAVKSAELFCVSLQPALPRKPAVVFDRFAVGEASAHGVEGVTVPNETRSMMPDAGH